MISSQKIRRTNEKHHYMKMNLMLRQWTDSALWKIRLLDINHRALIHFPQHQMPIRPIPSCCMTHATDLHDPNALHSNFANIHSTHFEFWCHRDLFWSGHIWSFIFLKHNFLTVWKYQFAKILIFVQKMSLIQMLTVLLMAQGQRNLL